jgi:hypothetical protein
MYDWPAGPTMNIDRILETMNRSGVAYLLFGGVNFLLRHGPVLTFDIDLWIDDTPENLVRCEKALAELQAEWGSSQADWQPVSRLAPGWLERQSVHCLSSPHGAIDIFRRVTGLEDWGRCQARAELRKTSAGIPYLGLSDEDMLECQLALPETDRRQDRIQALRTALG